MKKAVLLIILLLSLINVRAEVINDPYQARLQAPHQLQILEEGPAAFQARLDLIQQAQKSIDIEYFIFRPDRASQRLLQALLERAEHGVKVRILIDKSPLAPPIGADAAFLFALKGIEIKYFNPITFLSIGRAFHRTHRKFIIVDGDKMITGGRNIGEEYYLKSGKFSFIDRDVMVAGPIVAPVQATFEDFWSHPLSQRPKVKKYHRKEHAASEAVALRHKRLRKAWRFVADPAPGNAFYAELEARGKKELELTPVLGCQEMEFASDRPDTGKEHRLFADVFYDQLEAAKSSVLMETPYFITLKRDRKLLEGLLERGVGVTLVTNSTNSNNHPMVSNVLNRKIDNWVEKGMEAYFMTGAKPDCFYCESPESVQAEIGVTYGLHSKSTLIDDKIAMFITFNLDPQSQVRSLEMGVFCHDGPEVAHHLKQLIKTHQDVSFGFDDNGRPDNQRGLLQGTSAWEKIQYVLRYLPSLIMGPLL